ncbi:MAG: M28 family peptidase, partial [Planctomycetes bacterium]|nr:M28 family peptidase [Planctomycetota bacterium]
QYLQEQHRDKIWLILGGLPLSLYGRAMALKPRAILAVENELWVLPKASHLRLTYRERFGSVPTVRISFADGLRLLKEGVKRVRVSTRSAEIPAESLNVVGELEGKGDGDEILLVCAHLDSVLGVTGAGDNASGVSILLELARVFARQGTKRALRFVGFGSEEIGLRGSIRYARELARADREERSRPSFQEAFDRTELLRHRLAVNLDMHGVILGRNRATCMGPPDLTSAVRLLSSEIGPAFESIQEGIFSSDGMSLAAVGVPGVAFARTGGSSVVTHSGADTIEYLDAEHLAMTGRFIEVFLRRHASESLVFPFAREIPAPVAQKVKDYFRERIVEILPPAEGAKKA